MLKNIQIRYEKFGTSIFTAMTQAANAANAVNLAQGFPSFDGPDEIKEAAINALRGTHNQYAPSIGIAPLRKLLAQRQNKRTGLNFNPDTETTIFSGATEALFCCFQAFFEAGDEIISFEPFFDCYQAGAFSVGAKLAAVPLNAPDWSFDEEIFLKSVSKKTKAILLNTPHNPTGKVFSKSEMEFIAGVAKKHDLLVITDEVYEDLVYDDYQHIRMATLEGMRDRTITISSNAKTFSFTGWKVGFAFAPERLSTALRLVHQFTVFCSATPLQFGMIKALELGDEYYKTLKKDYQERRDFLLKALTKANFKASRTAGTYFIMADYSHHSNKSDVDFSMEMTQTWKVAALPVSMFYADAEKTRKEMKYLRFAFCKDMEILQEAASRLCHNH